VQYIHNFYLHFPLILGLTEVGSKRYSVSEMVRNQSREIVKNMFEEPFDTRKLKNKKRNHLGEDGTMVFKDSLIKVISSPEEIDNIKVTNGLPFMEKGIPVPLCSCNTKSYKHISAVETFQSAIGNYKSEDRYYRDMKTGLIDYYDKYFDVEFCRELSACLQFDKSVAFHDQQRRLNVKDMKTFMINEAYDKYLKDLNADDVLKRYNLLYDDTSE